MGTTHFPDASMCAIGNHVGIDNTPNERVLTNIQYVEDKLEEARKILSDYFGHDTPIFVKYGYRCPALNVAVGSTSKTSAHLEGLAADTYYRGHEIDSIAAILMQHPTFMEGIDQLIIERGCLHFGLPCAASKYLPRHELRHDRMVAGVRQYPLITIWHRAPVANPND